MSNKKENSKAFMERMEKYLRTKIGRKQEKIFNDMIPDKETKKRCLLYGHTSSYILFLNQFSHEFPKSIIFNQEGKEKDLKFRKRWKYTMAHTRGIPARNFIDGIRKPLGNIGLIPKKETKYFHYLPPENNPKKSESVERKRELDENKNEIPVRNKHKKRSLNSEHMNHQLVCGSLGLLKKHHSLPGGSYDEKNDQIATVTEKMERISLPQKKKTPRRRKTKRKKKKFLLIKSPQKTTRKKSKTSTKKETKQKKNHDDNSDWNTNQFKMEKGTTNSNVIYDNIEINNEKEIKREKEMDEEKRMVHKKIIDYQKRIDCQKSLDQKQNFASVVNQDNKQKVSPSRNIDFSSEIRNSIDVENLFGDDNIGLLLDDQQERIYQNGIGNKSVDISKSNHNINGNFNSDENGINIFKESSNEKEPDSNFDITFSQSSSCEISMIDQDWLENNDGDLESDVLGFLKQTQDMDLKNLDLCYGDENIFQSPPQNTDNEGFFSKFN
ncbi:hypothetical protein M0812_06904 [Anaeramoeba flamelloides]|uniref:Uncharacterized protein n=1 Tax=Anaeramoeba flamelloides TaxID=1746091 RepID=A0AAV8AA39_9EUKA|nr:hypothetical protein M0812_06904 [Anaeramoeba flamelloides]